MKAIVFDRIGQPLDILYLAELRLPEAKDNTVLVKMLAASIDAGDLCRLAEPRSGRSEPQLRQRVAGNHGVGIVRESGPGVAIKPGTMVAFCYHGSWAEYAAIPAQWLLPLPHDFPIGKGSQVFQLMFAWDLLEHAQVGPGQWLAIIAGYSPISMLVLQFARSRGVNVIAIVDESRPDLDLRTLGAAGVIDLSGHPRQLRSNVMDITAGKGVDAVVNSVGGPTMVELEQSMTAAARLVINGGEHAHCGGPRILDQSVVRVRPHPHIHRRLSAPPQAHDHQVLLKVAEIAGHAGFRVPLSGAHFLDDFKAAIGKSLQEPGHGKRLFKISA
ncbi:quinone oxidoreductase family protein [Inquilinus sp. OTU3971]|uniref:quinone oxidoreductase family protein n=1 Tax=Inquilinus sp. OTU3971 TaxID=3043855 RepID=UPI00313C9E26